MRLCAISLEETGTITKEIMDDWYMRFIHVSYGTRAQMISFVRDYSHSTSIELFAKSPNIEKAMIEREG